MLRDVVDFEPAFRALRGAFEMARSFNEWIPKVSFVSLDFLIANVARWPLEGCHRVVSPKLTVFFLNVPEIYRKFQLRPLELRDAHSSPSTSSSFAPFVDCTMSLNWFSE